MKGISPIVAAVLLIAITMTIAGILAYWSTTFVAQGLPGENITNTQCRFAQFEFVSCKYNTTAQNVIFVLENVKTTEITNLTTFVTYSNGSVSTGVDLNSSLGTGAQGLKSYSVSGVPSDFTRITIKTSCPELSRSHTCR
ncbi:MAG: hypothetical protein HYW24_04055 [Candidatus Aenigmarchaeota archaeon]|nr:hypothetical protein [Candidatus Aenigmarchaeota archaeon]